jgi:pimeloyl-ACP methyl ester carboxylesterase
MAYAKTPHGKIHYSVKGEGSTVVLIRGLGSWSVHWSGWDYLLAKTCRVITYDKMGMGLSPTTTPRWQSLTELADDVAIILKHEKIAKAHIVGTSLGGMVAMTFALEHPELTQSLTVIASSIGRSGHMRMSWRAASLLLFRPLNNKNFYADLAALLTSDASAPSVRQKLAQDWKKIEREQKTPILTVIAQLAAAFTFKKWENLAKIKCPTQTVVGNDDAFVARGNSLFLHSRLPGSKLIELENAGHEPHIDKPELMAEIITSFASASENKA